MTEKYSLDLLSKSNPVYLSLFVVAICEGHQGHSGRPIEIASIYLALPICCSNYFQASFSNTNIKTGIFSWLTKQQETIYMIPQSIRNTSKFTNSAIQFCAQARMIEINESGEVSVKKNGHKALTTQSKKSRTPLKRAMNFGAWISDIGDSKDLFSALGIKA